MHCPSCDISSKGLTMKKNVSFEATVFVLGSLTLFGTCGLSRASTGTFAVDVQVVSRDTIDYSPIPVMVRFMNVSGKEACQPPEGLWWRNGKTCAAITKTVAPFPAEWEGECVKVPAGYE